MANDVVEKSARYFDKPEYGVVNDFWVVHFCNTETRKSVAIGIFICSSVGTKLVRTIQYVPKRDDILTTLKILNSQFNTCFERENGQIHPVFD